MPIKNPWGLEAHPTDEMLDPWDMKMDSKGRLKKESLDMVERIRTAYDAIVAAGLKAELEVCMEMSYEAGASAEADMNNPDL